MNNSIALSSTTEPTKPSGTESPFRNDGKQFAWDSISYGWLIECPRKYYLAMIEGWQAKARNVHLDFGLIFQKCDELFAKHRTMGYAHDEALKHVVSTALRLSYGWEHTHTLKTRESLIRSIVWYFDNYRDDPCETVVLHNGLPAVELSFRLEVQPGLFLTGHLDRLVRFSGGFYAKDIKTTGSTIGGYFFDKFGLDHQMTGYAIASKIVYNTPATGVMIDGVQVAKGFTAFDRGFTYRTREQMDEWLKAFSFYTGQYLDVVREADFPMNTKACLNGFSDDPTKDAGGCVFRQICGKDPRVRTVYLEGNFEKRNWNPLESR